jgi:mRNA interferase MazF
MEITQGDIFLADLNPVKGHEQAGFRPVLVLQNNILNRHLRTVVIAPITSNLQLKGFMTTFFLNNKNSKLKKDSLALLFQIRTIDKSRLVKKTGELNQNNFSHLRVKLMRIFW